MVVLLPAVLGAFAVLAFVVSTVQSRPYPGGVIADGTIVAVQTERTVINRGTVPRRRMTTYAPTVEFTDATGTRRSVTGSLSGGVRPTVGAPVRVSYLPNDPDRARIIGGPRERVGRILFLIVGLGLIAAAVAVGVR